MLACIFNTFDFHMVIHVHSLVKFKQKSPMLSPNW